MSSQFTLEKTGLCAEVTGLAETQDRPSVKAFDCARLKRTGQQPANKKSDRIRRIRKSFFTIMLRSKVKASDWSEKGGFYC